MMTICDNTKVLLVDTDLTYEGFIKGLQKFQSLADDNHKCMIWVETDQSHFMFRQKHQESIFDTKAKIESYDNETQMSWDWDNLADLWYSFIEERGYKCLILQRL